MSVVLAAVVALMPLLHEGQRQWYAPGALQSGSKVVCVAHGTRLVVTVPGGSSSNDVWRTGLQASVTTRANGAVEFDCGVTEAPPRIAPTRFLVSRHGLGLLRGQNTRARLEGLYRRGVAHGCALSWPSIGLRATFAGCSAGAALTGATVTGSRWSTLDGVHVGDSVARMLWQDAGATRANGSWILGGVGVRQPPRLLALVGPAGTVTGFRIVSR